MRNMPQHRIIPGYRSDTYLCPNCYKECERYTPVVNDYGYIKRKDNGGTLCVTCFDKMRMKWL